MRKKDPEEEAERGVKNANSNLVLRSRKRELRLHDPHLPYELRGKIGEFPSWRSGNKSD